MSKTKVFLMGEEISMEELPASPALALEDHFAPVTISPKALDRASQIVPEEYWQTTGIHTWLSGRANAVFQKMSVGQTEGELGKLKYFYEFDATGPILKAIALI